MRNKEPVITYNHCLLVITQLPYRYRDILCLITIYVDHQNGKFEKSKLGKKEKVEIKSKPEKSGVNNKKGKVGIIISVYVRRFIHSFIPSYVYFLIHPFIQSFICFLSLLLNIHKFIPSSISFFYTFYSPIPSILWMHFNNYKSQMV